MTKLAPRGLSAAATSLALSIAFAAALAFPATGLAEGGGEGPVLTFSPAPLEFGKTTVGSESPTATVDVYNAGDASAPVDQVVVEGTDSGDFKATGSNCGQVEPGQHCSVWVSFAPGSSGEKQAILGLQLKEAPTQTLQLAGSAVPAQLAFTPGSYDFGIQRVNRSESSAYFQLANVGEAGAQVSSVGIGGLDSNNFWTNGGDCWGGRWLQPGESCSVQIGFNPWDMTSYQAELQAYVNGATFVAPLAGSGGRAMVEPTSSPSDFGAVTAGTAGAVETIVFVNHGNLPGNFFIGIVAGGDSGSFRLLDEDCSTAPVPPSGTCTAHVRFVPQSAGPKVARMAFFAADDGGTMAMLTGEGVAAAATLAPSAFDFGSEVAGSGSAAHAFAVHNDGGTSLDLDSVAIVGPDLDQFGLAGDECSGTTLAPGDECLVRVRFIPDSDGAKAATLRVRGEAGAFTAALTGSGLADVEQAAVSGTASAFAAVDRPAGQPRTRRHRRFVRGASISTAAVSCRPARRPCGGGRASR